MCQNGNSNFQRNYVIYIRSMTRLHITSTILNISMTILVKVVNLGQRAKLSKLCVADHCDLC